MPGLSPSHCSWWGFVQLLQVRLNLIQKRLRGHCKLFAGSLDSANVDPFAALRESKPQRVHEEGPSFVRQIWARIFQNIQALVQIAFPELAHLSQQGILATS